MITTKAVSRVLLPAILASALMVAPGQSGENPLTCKNVIIVLDASLSMSSRMRGGAAGGATSSGLFHKGGMSKMDAAKAALQEVLKRVPRDTHIGLLVFSSSNLKSDWVHPLGPRNDDELKQAINLPQPGGQTPLGTYIKKAADRLLEQRARQQNYGTYRLLIVTDGEATDGKLTDRYVPQVLARGITIDVVGVDMDTTHTLATKVRSYRSAGDPASLTKAVADVFAEVGKAGSDVAGEDAFGEIAPIPAEVAMAMLKALCVFNNDPIGEGPRSRAPAAP